jgi:hypothetical protein
MNAHGDVWQEPTLFDQGGDPNTTLPAHTFADDVSHAVQLDEQGSLL